MDRNRNPGGGGLSLQTLVISSLSAAAAAILVPMFWEQGTLFATAMTPVVVALVSEALRRPAERIGAVAPRVARRTATGAAVRVRRPDRVGARGEGPERFEPLPRDGEPRAPRADGPPDTPPRPDDPFGLRAAERRRPRLKIALVTGLIAFVIAAAVVTASELALFGGSVGSDRSTSLFGGHQSSARKDRQQQRSQPGEEPGPTATPTAEETPTPEETATPAPTTTTTPTPTTIPSPEPQSTP